MNESREELLKRLRDPRNQFLFDPAVSEHAWRLLNDAAAYIESPPPEAVVGAPPAEWGKCWIVPVRGRDAELEILLRSGRFEFTDWPRTAPPVSPTDTPTEKKS